jgi:SAM-dependent methyltransferase
MSELVHSSEDLREIYRTRFAGKAGYRQQLWSVLASYFSRWIPSDGTVLDLGCGYCEFANSVQCRKTFAMDLNPDAFEYAAPNVTVLPQDCSKRWEMEPESLDTVFTSNFFEHLPNKTALEKTLQEAYRALKPGGRIIAMGPNIKYLPGAYWDFYDHYLPLTHLSLLEVLNKIGFELQEVHPRFLPYTMSHGRQYPVLMVRVYLRVPLAWRVMGKQFLIVASKPLP